MNVISEIGDAERLSLSSLPNELIDGVFACLSTREIVRLSAVCQAWHRSARVIYRARIVGAFGYNASLRYVFEASQPADKRVQGSLLTLRKTAKNGNSRLDIPSTAVAAEYTSFEFGASPLSNKTYKFKIEPDTFIQLCIVGNIIEPRKQGGLEGVAQHLEAICRVKQENVDTVVGQMRTLKVNDQCLLDFRLLARTSKNSGHDEHVKKEKEEEEEEGPVSYEIEYKALHLNSAHLLHAVEIYEASKLTGKALVLRSTA